MLRALVISLVAVGNVLFACAPSLADLKYRAEVTNDGLRLIVVEGEIEFADDLREFTASASASEAQVVLFNSPGGNIYRALEMGRLIRSLGLSTFQPRGLECASACALAFMGGVHRYAEPGSIGVHKSSFAPSHSMSAADAVSEIQSLTAAIVGFMVEMNVSPALLELALSYDADDIRYLSGSEMRRFRVSTDTVAPRAEPPTRTSEPKEIPASLEAKAAAFVGSVIGAHTMAAARALDKVQRAYGGEISYYGKRTGLSAVLEDKRAYFRRWPDRHYQVLPESLQVTCGTVTCTVSGIYDWSVRSYPRNRKASGRASFQYVLDVRFAGEYGFVVRSETSEVLDRY